MTHPTDEVGAETPIGGPDGVRLISLVALQKKLADNDDFVFVMAMDEGRFNMAHIDGSISFDQLQEGLQSLSHDREIVMYCTDAACAASKMRAAMLVSSGFTNVSRFAGGLAEWTAGGLPLVGGTQE